MKSGCSNWSRLPYLPLIAAIMCLFAYVAAYVVLELLSSREVVLTAVNRDRVFFVPVAGFLICEPVALVTAIGSLLRSWRGQADQITSGLWFAAIVSCLLIPVWLLALLMLAYAFAGGA